MNFKFKIVIPSYNNENWIEHNIASVLNQTLQDYEVLYINDASTDNTLQLVSEIVKDLPNWKIVSNKNNMRRGYNVSPHNENIKNFVKDTEDVLVFVDGDDWLFDENVLLNLKNFYENTGCWMTYGGMVCYPSGKEGYPQNTHYSEEVHSKKLYRKDHWRASHLRSFKWGLYNKIKEEHMIYKKTGEYYFHAEDLATSYPCLEMCPKNKIGVLDFFSYVFNESPSNRERGINRENEAGFDLEREIRDLTPYKEISTL